MPPKKAAADSADLPEPTSSEAPEKETAVKKSEAAAVRKLSAHPSTAVMVKEALQALDSRKGVSSQAIQSYIKEKYPSVDLVRLKHLVRNSLKKGIENGTLVRPANASVTTGAMGKFRLAPKVKELKPKGENVDPNVQTAPKAAKKPKKAGTTKKKNPANGETKSSEDKPPKKSKKDEDAAPSKVPPAKKPKAKTAATKESGEGSADPTKTKAVKTVKGAKAKKAPQSKAVKADGEAPATKATGKRGKKTE
ncbi:linker histone H1M [Leuresthes tenuis]|uniref:linker histone H1M n=1 Tax=Leuresthes tenuis TaxID=355514 RepID=UPI003B5091EC